MSRTQLALLAVVAALLAACGSDSPRQRSCDDGGSGGVVIDGVCL